MEGQRPRGDAATPGNNLRKERQTAGGSFEAQHPRSHDGTWTDKNGGKIPKVSAADARRNWADKERLDTLIDGLNAGEATPHTGADGKPCLSIAGFDGENVEAWCETEGRRHWLCLQTDGGHTVRIRWDKDAARKTDCCLGFLHTAHRNGWTVKDTPEYCAHRGSDKGSQGAAGSPPLLSPFELYSNL